MSSENATLKVTILGEDKSASRAMGSVGRSSDGLASKLGRVAGGIGKALGGATLATAGIGIAAGKMGLEVAAGNEQAKISFTTMLGSAKKADKFLRDMVAFANATPFDMASLQTAAGSLISVGVEADKVIPIMTTLGNVTSGMGTGSEGIQRATVALQQMNAAQRISAEDLNQLRDAGIPVYDLLAKATGKSKKAIVEMAGAGKLGKKELDAMMKALETGKGLERFNGLMEKQSQSLTGLVSSFKDNLGQGLARAVTPLIPLIKDGLNVATQKLAEILPKVAAGMATGAAKVRAFIAGFRGGGDVKKVSKSLGDVVSIGDKARAVFDMLKDKAGKAFAGLKNVNAGDTLDKLQVAFVKLAPAVDKFTTNLPKTEPVARKAGEVFGFIADHADLLAKALPFVVSAFALVKAAQAANTVVGKDSVVGMGLQIAGNLSLASSNRALAAALNGTTGSQNAGMLATLRSTAVTAAAAVKQGVLAAASKTMAAAQWLVNAAMSANPIGIVVVALAALAAGLVYAYKNSETFRNICDAAFKAVGKIINWLWTTIYRPVFKFMLAAISTVANGFADFLELLSHVPGFGWAKDAADKIRGAAREVDKFKDGLDKIDVYKEVNVVTKFTYKGYKPSLDKHNASVMERHGHDPDANATGGRNLNAGWSWVGEHGPELMYVPGGANIYNASESQRINGNTTRKNQAAQAKIDAAKRKAAEKAKKAAQDKAKAAADKAKKDAEKKRKDAELAARRREWARLIGGHIDAKGRVINKYGDVVGLPSAQRLAEKKAAAKKVGGHFNAFGDVVDKHGKVVTVATTRSQHHAQEVGKKKGKAKGRKSSSRSRGRSSGGSSGGSGGGGNVYVDVAVTVQGHVMTDKQLATTLTPAIRNELIKIGRRNNNHVFPPPIT